MFFSPLVVSRDLVKPGFSIPLTRHTSTTIFISYFFFSGFLTARCWVGASGLPSLWWCLQTGCGRYADDPTLICEHWGPSSMASAAEATPWHFMPLVSWCINPNSLLGSQSPFRTAGKRAMLLLGEEVDAEHRIGRYSTLSVIHGPDGLPFFPWGMLSSHGSGPFARLPLPMALESKQTHFTAKL